LTGKDNTVWGRYRAPRQVLPRRVTRGGGGRLVLPHLPVLGLQACGCTPWNTCPTLCRVRSLNGASSATLHRTVGGGTAFRR